MKKIMNRAEDMLLEMCSGMVSANPQLELIAQYKIIKKRQINCHKVTLISGGGSGHEPAHAGFIGLGMLDAAVCGDIFASPSQIQIYQAIKATQSKQGTLLIIKNYSGDMMNFKNAAFLAELEGLSIDYIKVDDDIAVQDSLYTVGRRGVAGTIFVHKIAGAAAEAGEPLNEVKRVASKAADSVRSMGFAFSSCTVPAKGSPTFTLPDDEIEYGVGIHGEPGRERKKQRSIEPLAIEMVNALLAELHLSAKQPVELLINGFGSTPLLELYILNFYVMRELAQLAIPVEKVLVGNYMTSLDMAGASLSIMKLDQELAHYLSQTCDTPALHLNEATLQHKPHFFEIIQADKTTIAHAHALDHGDNIIKDNRINFNNMKFIISKMADIIIAHEQPFCELDAYAGDGDFGMSIAKGFRQLKNEWFTILQPAHTISAFLDSCAITIMEYCGGASGPIWGFAFKSAAVDCQGKSDLALADFASLLQASVKGIQKVGERAFGRGAVVGDKTLIDALIPCADSWQVALKNALSLQKAFQLGAAAAVMGAKKTEQISARMGRAGTVGNRSIGYPDAGAHALGLIFTEIADSLVFTSHSSSSENRRQYDH